MNRIGIITIAFSLACANIRAQEFNNSRSRVGFEKGESTSVLYGTDPRILAFRNSSLSGIVTVPGTAGLWLAGMPDGTSGHRDDFAPAQSPIWVSDLVLTDGAWIEVSNVSGSVNNAPTGPGFTPDGDLSRIITRTIGAEHGKSDLVAPINSLIGVFLNSAIPAAPVPPTLDFSSAISRDYLELHPDLQQPFFIGDGMISSLTQQKIHIPNGATRLFLGTMDTRDSYNNWGSFIATVTAYRDCNSNGVVDEVDILSGTSSDCNTNGIPDSCDIASGFSQDCNNNDVPDECDIASAETQTLSFTSTVPGTITDASGLGTGFTLRLPGTGSSIPANDPNMDLASTPGLLQLTSTHADINQTPFSNLPQLEAPGLFAPGFGASDFVVSGVFRDVRVPNGSDQLMLYVGTSATHVVRAGFHNTNVYSLSENQGSGDVNQFTAPNAFATGDDVRLSLSRTGNQWTFSWQNLTNPAASGSMPSLMLPWLDADTDLYLGVIASNAGTTTPFIGKIDSFSITGAAGGGSNDCNGNGIPDDCDIASESSQDCNTNNIPDECDISSGTSQDCNTNVIPDSCDIASGLSQDCDSSGIPDSCETNLGPAITQQPAAQTVCVGQSVTFLVAATGVAPISYQWRKDGIDISGATGSSFTINPVTQGSAGSYDVVATNSCGFVTSTAATLTVNEGGACACADIATVRSMALGLPVKICNVVVSSTTDLIESATQKSFFVQDATGGLAVFGTNAVIDALLAGIAEGHSIDLLGTTSQFQGLFQLVNPLTLVSEHGIVGILTPDAVTPVDFQDGSPTAEFHEGRLAQLSCVKFLETGLFDGVRSYSVSADGGATTVTVRISTNALNLVGTSIPCGPVNLRGIFGQFDTTEPRDGRYELRLRSTADITVCPGSVDCNTNGVPDECDIASWKLRSTANAPSQREWHAMAYDSSRGLSILFGGEDATSPANGETWQWNGNAWTQRLVAGPAPRSRHAMVYDASRAVVVLFGGWDGTSILGDTWEWDGLNWAQRSNSGPSARFLHGMAYDSIRQVSVLFGGYDSATYNGETWEWNGTNWSLRSSTGPSSRYGHGMSYDLGRGTTVLFGGAEAPNGSFSGQTWEWNGGFWTLRASTGPSPRYGVAMAYNQGRGLTILSGGYTGAYDRETWEWNGNTWLLRSSGGPSPRLYHAMDYDIGRGTMVLFGGQTGTPTYYNNETWEFANSATSSDCNANNVPDECEQTGQDCNGNSILDVCEIASGSSQDCNSNGVPDSCELAADDCNGNGVLDSCELTGQDCDGNGILDSCELIDNDCNANGNVDACDVADGTSYDCDEDGILDECEIVGGETDCNGNSVPDSCEIAGQDCNSNSILDSCDIASGTSQDCNANGVPDSCELAGHDCNANGVPDECEVVPSSNWMLLTESGPSARRDHAMAYDSFRNRAVLFGGTDSQRQGDTWELNGTTWELRATSGPSPRTDHAMVYDSNRHVTVLFGGHDGIDNGQTWEWGGTSWAHRSSSGPSPRTGHAMAYDSGRGRTVLFGGLGGSLNGETWEWDGTSWTLRSSSGPSPRSDHAMAYDSVRNQVVLFGGYDGANKGDTWTWDGSAWTLRSTTGPGVRSEHTMVFDADHGFVVLFGGVANPTKYGDTWIWNGSTWQLIAANGPSARYDQAMVFDLARGTVQLNGGFDSALNGQTWEYTFVAASLDCNSNSIPDSCDITAGTSQDCNNNSVPDECDIANPGTPWTLVSTTGPSPRGRHATAFDSARSVVVLFGGRDNSANYLNDTWEWNGSTWSLRATTGPSVRGDHKLAYDSARGVTVLFGGALGESPLGDTWEWNGATWTQVATSGPSARRHPGMAYDSARHVTVLFGGSSGSNETWEWNGTVWTLRATSGPTPVTIPGMAYDSARGVCVLFGGIDSGGANGQTWEWDGSSWTLRSSTGPSPRYHAELAYDSARSITILYGGVVPSGQSGGDTWSWDGTTWTLRETAGPSPRILNSLCYDAARAVTFLFGGGSADPIQSDSQSWVYSPTAASQDCNNNGIPDSCDLASGTSQDCNSNSVPDSCDIAGGASDCDNNGVPDSCDLASGTSPDCNTNGVLDVCEAPVTSWTQRSSTGPSPREWHAMAYDSIRGVTVLFGGEDISGPANGETWEWDGNTWIQRSTNGPAPRSRHTMVYDATRGVCVLFGGWNGSNYFADTWEWDGNSWAMRSTSGPSPRFLQGMTYDIARGVTVLFGGAVYSGGDIVYLGETWEWNGSTWTLRPNAPGTEPSARYSPVVAYDVGRGVTVLFGGEQGNGNGTSRETWEWNGTTWTLRSTSGPPPGYAGSMVYDASRGVEVMFGNYAGVYNAQTWEWDDGVWTLRSSTGPSPRLLHASAFDSGRSKMVTFGGQINAMPPYDGETWELTTTDLLAINGHPGNQKHCAGGSAMFTVTAAGPSLTYQWRKNGVPIANETGASLTINPIAATDVGNYDCVVTSPCGSVTSLPGTLTVIDPIPAAHYALATYCPAATITSPYLLGITDDGPVENSCWGQRSSRIFAGVINQANGKLWRVRQTCVSQQFGPTLCSPESVLVDREGRWQSLCTTPNLLIVGGCNTLFFVNPSSGTVCEKFVDPTFNHIGQLALDSMGRLFVGSVDGNSLNIIDMGVVEPFYTVVGQSPRAIAVDAMNNIYVTCPADGVMRKLAPDGTVIDASFATGLTGAISQAIAPLGIFHGNMFVACGDRVMEVDLATGESSVFLPCQDVAGIAFDPDGFMNVSAPMQNHIKKIGPALPGDMNGDGSVTLADVAGFAAALMLQPNAPLPTITADMNSDGCLSGLDIQLFVNAVLP